VLSASAHSEQKAPQTSQTSGLGELSPAASSTGAQTAGLTEESASALPTPPVMPLQAPIKEPQEQQRDSKQRRATGRRSYTRTSRKQGRAISSSQVPRVTDLALVATLRAAALFQRQRHARLSASPEFPFRKPALRVLIQSPDLRQKVRISRTRNVICFVVDASWSMAVAERMAITKAVVLSLLREAYHRRDLVGLVSFQRDFAAVLLPLTPSGPLAQKRLQAMPVGGKTPLARGLLTGYEVLARARTQDPEIIPLLVLLTDGQANVAMGSQSPQEEANQVATFIATQKIRAVVFDTAHASDRGLAAELAKFMGGHYFCLEDFTEDAVAQAIRTQLK